MHWLCFPVCLFNIGIGGSRTGKVIRESELGLLPTNGSCARAQGAGQHQDMLFTCPPPNRWGPCPLNARATTLSAPGYEAYVSSVLNRKDFARGLRRSSTATRNPLPNCA